MKNSQKGFSLIELLIVVLTISIIAAIAIPNVIASRRTANEGSAISSLRAIHSAEFIYSTTSGGGSFTDDLAVLENAGMIDGNLGSEYKSGYHFKVRVDPSTTLSFTVGAVPQVTSGMMKTGTRKFCMTAHGFPRMDNNPATLGVNIENDGDCTAANYSTEL
jgi:type IV pilus assembly protein PilA